MLHDEYSNASPGGRRRFAAAITSNWRSTEPFVFGAPVPAATNRENVELGSSHVSSFSTTSIPEAISRTS